MKIMIAYDGVHPMRYFTADLKKSGLPVKAQGLVFTVVDEYVPPSEDLSSLSLPSSTVTYIESIRAHVDARIKKELKQAKKISTKAAQQLRLQFRGWSILDEACTDSPVWGIIKKSDQWKSDLIILGSHNAAAAVKFILGSVSRGVVLHSKCSVRIVRKSNIAAARKPRIVIAMDGSRGAQAAVNRVAQGHWPNGAEVRLVTVSERNIGELSDVRRMTHPFALRLKGAGLQVSDVIKAGKPWQIIVKEAESWKADSIFMGARGLSLLDRVMLGSVSNAVVSRAHCTVEVVRGQ